MFNRKTINLLQIDGSPVNVSLNMSHQELTATILQPDSFIDVAYFHCDGNFDAAQFQSHQIHGIYV